MGQGGDFFRLRNGLCVFGVLMSAHSIHARTHALTRSLTSRHQPIKIGNNLCPCIVYTANDSVARKLQRNSPSIMRVIRFIHTVRPQRRFLASGSRFPWQGSSKLRLKNGIVGLIVFSFAAGVYYTAIAKMMGTVGNCMLCFSDSHSFIFLSG